MDIAEIRKLIRVMRDHGILELEVQDRRGKIRLVRENGARADAAPRGGAAWAGRPPARGGSPRVECFERRALGCTGVARPPPAGGPRPTAGEALFGGSPGRTRRDSSRTPSHRTEFWDRSDACFAGC